MYDDCKITEDEDGTWNAVSVQGILTVLPDGETRVFMRNAIKFAVGEGGDPNRGGKHRMLVGQLDDVRVYVCGNKVILTKQDLYF
jgi:hypothetical protein